MEAFCKPVSFLSPAKLILYLNQRHHELLQPEFRRPQRNKFIHMKIVTYWRNIIIVITFTPVKWIHRSSSFFFWIFVFLASGAFFSFVLMPFHYVSECKVVNCFIVGFQNKKPQWMDVSFSYTRTTSLADRADRKVRSPVLSYSSGGTSDPGVLVLTV